MARFKFQGEPPHEEQEEVFSLTLTQKCNRWKMENYYFMVSKSANKKI